MAETKGGDLGRLKFREIAPGQWESYREGEKKPAPIEDVQAEPTPIEDVQAEPAPDTEPKRRGRKPKDESDGVQ